MTPADNIILNKKQIDHKIRRIAYQIYENNVSEKEVIIAGIYKNGFLFAQKIKKETGFSQINLIPTPDILAHLGAVKEKQFLVGFALETENELENAQGKLERKNLDAIVLNSLNDANAGFGGDQNKITYLQPNTKPIAFELKTKAAVAVDVFDQILLAYEKTS